MVASPVKVGGLKCWRCGSTLATYETVNPRDPLTREPYPLLKMAYCPRCGLNLPYDYAWLVNYAVLTYMAVAGRGGSKRCLENPRQLE